MMNIDRQSLLPLYHQVEETLQRDIVNGVYQPDQPIPTEIALQKKYDVSRETVRKAVNNLMLAGVVEKRKGTPSVTGKQKAFGSNYGVYGYNKLLKIKQLIHTGIGNR